MHTPTPSPTPATDEQILARLALELAKLRDANPGVGDHSVTIDLCSWSAGVRWSAYAKMANVAGAHCSMFLDSADVAIELVNRQRVEAAEQREKAGVA